MKHIAMLVLKVGGAVLILLLLLVVMGVRYFRFKPRIERWYYSRLDLKPAEIPTGLDQALLNELDSHFIAKNFGNVGTFSIWQDGEVRYQFNQM